MRVSELLDLCANDNYEEIDFYDEVNQINDTTTARNIDNGTTEYNWADATVEYWYANFDAGVLQIKATLPYIKSSNCSLPKRRVQAARGQYPVRTLPIKYHDKFNLDEYPNFSASGSVSGMRRYYGADALLVKCGSYIYNVTENPEIYWNYAH